MQPISRLDTDLKRENHNQQLAELFGIRHGPWNIEMLGYHDPPFCFLNERWLLQDVSPQKNIDKNHLLDGWLVSFCNGDFLQTGQVVDLPLPHLEPMEASLLLARRARRPFFPCDFGHAAPNGAGMAAPLRLGPELLRQLNESPVMSALKGFRGVKVETS